MARTSAFRFLAKAGMGVVYEAEQTQPVRRRVALKVIKLGMDTAEGYAYASLRSGSYDSTNAFGFRIATGNGLLPYKRGPENGIRLVADLDPQE